MNNAVATQPKRAVAVQRTPFQPIRVGSSHVGHSNAAFIPEHTPLPSLPSIPDEPIDKKSEINSNDRIVSTQTNVSSIGSPTHELQIDFSQVIVDSSMKTEWQKPESAIELIPAVQESSNPSTSNIGSSEIVVVSSSESKSKECEQFDKTIIDKESHVIVSSSSNNQIVSTQTIESSKQEIVATPAQPITKDHKTETNPSDNGQIGSSQVVVESSIKTECVQIAPIQSSAQMPTQHTQQTTSTVYQSTSSKLDTQINQIVSSIIANENAFGKKSIEPTASIGTMQVTSEPGKIAGMERIASSVDEEISEAFKEFVSGLMSTTPEARKMEPIFMRAPNESVTVVSTEMPAIMPMDEAVSTTIEAAKDIISNEIAQSDQHSTEVIETIPSVVEVVTTQPTATGYAETKVIATKFTSDGPTFLEVSKTGFHTDMTSATSELQSTQIISKSTFSYQDDQLISTSQVSGDSVATKNEITSVTKTTSNNEQTFTSITEINSSSTQIISSPDDGPTIVEISSTTAEPGSPQITSYVVSEPSYDYAECSLSYEDTSDSINNDNE